MIALHFGCTKLIDEVKKPLHLFAVGLSSISAKYRGKPKNMGKIKE